MRVGATLCGMMYWMKTGCLVGLVFLGFLMGVCVRGEEAAAPSPSLFSTPLPLVVRRNVGGLVLRVSWVGDGDGVTTGRVGVVRVVSDPGAVAYDQGSGTSVVSEVEAHLLVSQLQSDGFFSRATVVSGGVSGADVAGGIIELSGFDDTGRVIREVVAAGEEWRSRVGALGKILGESATPACCDSCRGLMAIASIGVCGKCGGATRSGAFPVCTACALKAGECERCERKLPVRAGELLRRLVAEL